MASKKIQTILAAKGKCERLILKRRFCWGRHPEQGQGDIHNSTGHFHIDSSQGKRREPVINLASLGAKKNTARAEERNSRIFFIHFGD
ncbi:unnamed protein product [Prunus armeniaca]